MSYRHDIFISYRRQTAAAVWLEQHFLPLLEKWLPEFLPPGRALSMFIDRGIETGSEWPRQLKDALAFSRCLLPILSAPYFGSIWCQAEWQNFLERQRHINKSNSEARIIYPVVFADGENFPEEAKAIQARDFTQWGYTGAVFAQSLEFLKFEAQVKLLAKELAQIIQAAPAWQKKWPAVSLPPIPQTFKIMAPRL